ncbi:hypothetical protein EAE96_004612 [Botrytis aclada]|nr:hypothetical protein EAE96_004612 [Botrytis aclada]
MHFTKPAVVVASLLWATTFASPIESPTILRTRGLIGGSTTDDNTKNTTGGTTANNAVGSDNTKSASDSNAVEDALGSLKLEEITGSLGSRDDSKLRHGHKRPEDDIVNDALDIADDATPDRFFDRTTRHGAVDNVARSLNSRDVSGHHISHKGKGNGTVNETLKSPQSVGGGDDTGNSTGGIIDGGKGRNNTIGPSVNSPAEADPSDTGFLGNLLGRTTRRGIAGDVLKRHHHHKGEGNGIANGAVDSAQDATGGAGMGGATGGDDLGDAAGGILGGDGRSGGVSDDSVKDATHTHDDVKGDTSGGVLGGLLSRLVRREKDGAVHDANQAAHDANQAAHDANKAVHEANKFVHSTVHGLLHGILR